MTAMVDTRPCELIRITDVNKMFKTTAGEYPALKNINLCFGQGEYVSIIGKSGSGKSTLLNMITGIDHPTTGTVTINGLEVHRLPESKLADWRAINLGIVFQFFQLLPMLSVMENIMLPMDFANRLPPAERQSRAQKLLALVGLSEYADQLPAGLAGGMQQMAAIARALANDPPLIVADEPTGNLDTRTAERVLDLFDNLVAQGKTVIIVTHDSTLAARAARQILISDGQVVDENVVQALRFLPNAVLLKISRLVVTRQAQAGDILLGTHSGVPNAPARRPVLGRIPDFLLRNPGNAVGGGLYIVVEGALEVAGGRNDRRLEVLERLEAGAYFSSIDLATCGLPALHLRVAADGPARLLWLSQESLNRLIEDSHTVEIALSGQAEQRRQRYRSQIPGRR